MELGIGIGWRPEIADEVEALAGIDWVEAVAENLCADHLPASLVRLRERGVTVVPHGVALGLGGADRPDPGRLAALAARAELLGTPLVTEHIAFVRAGGPLTASPRLEAGHLLPVPRTWDALDVLCENVRIAQDSLPVPLALENIAALISWPGEELTEGQFLAELVERTGVRLLIDVANLHTNHVNLGQDPAKALDELPVEAIAYVHVAGGVEKNGVWHDTHAHPVSEPVLEVLAELRSRVDPPGVLLERDDAFPPGAELAGELDAIRATLRQAATVRVPAAAGERTSTSAAGERTGVADPVAAEAGERTSTAAAIERRGTADPAPAEGRAAADPMPAGTRDRTAVAQTALLSALVAGTPAPEGFDHRRLRVQSRALAAKRADVVAKVAPELPEILGDGYRAAFLAYAGSRPMSGGYRRDALDFAEHVLIAGGPADPAARRRLTYWWQDRSGARPPGRTTRLVRAARAVLVGK
ncbi:multinuclear nonheme iron-dependent oxidase [Streptomyces griseus]